LRNIQINSSIVNIILCLIHSTCYSSIAGTYDDLTEESVFSDSHEVWLTYDLIILSNCSPQNTSTGLNDRTDPLICGSMIVL